MTISVMGGGVIIPVGSGGLADGSVTGTKVAQGLLGGDQYIEPAIYYSVVQGTWSIFCNAAFWHNAVFWDSSDANGDELTFKAFFENGATYTVELMTNDDSTRGILKIYVDGTLVHTHDNYSAATANNTKSSSNMTFSGTTGIKTVRAVVDGKNAASVHYQVFLTGLRFVKKT